VPGPRLAALAALVALPVVAACAPAPASTRAPATAAAAALRCTPADRRRALDAFVTENRGRYDTAISRARAFLDPLEVNPQSLRSVNIKGKKKLVEALDAYYRLYQVATPAARPALLAKVEALARPTTEDRYHDMLTIADREFKEDATSYLRAALLLDRLGLDTSRYRREIAAVKWRLDAHMRERGPHQRRAFHAYYQHFGLAEPFPLEGALDKGFIAARAEPDKLPRMDVYAFTHEIFAAYDFGEKLDADAFSEADRAYLQGALPRLTTTWIEKRDPDLVAELVSCLRYAQLSGDPSYVAGLRYLLDEQNSDGSWAATRRRGAGSASTSSKGSICTPRWWRSRPSRWASRTCSARPRGRSAGAAEDRPAPGLAPTSLGLSPTSPGLSPGSAGAHARGGRAWRLSARHRAASPRRRRGSGGTPRPPG